MSLCPYSTASILARMAAAAALAVSGSAFADNDHHHGKRDDAKTRLSGYMEVPALSVAASGRFKAKIDDKTSSISYELSYEDLGSEVRQAHIHLGQKGVNGGVMVFLCQTTNNPDPTGLAPTCPQSGTVTGTLSAANVIGPAGQGVAATEFAEVVAAIRAGAAYVNVHTANFGGGEIRGQLDDD